MRAGREHVPNVCERPLAADAQAARGRAAVMLGLQRSVGNRTVARLVGQAPSPLLQRKVGWSDAVTDGYGWNVGEHAVGKIRRIPVELADHGLPKDAPTGALTPERADHRAIVLVPAALDASQIVDYVVFLHGYTEDATTRPYGGWRALRPAPTPPERGSRRPRDPTPQELKLAKWRHGIDDKDIAPVRDVALDQADQQLEDSGLTQLVIVLPQGGLTSQFGDVGNAAQYVQAVADELSTDRLWRDATGNPVKSAPMTGRVTMAGHSGAGATLGVMATNASERLRHPGTKEAQNPYALQPVGDLVIFDAINGPHELGGYQAWVSARLDIDLRMLKSKADESAQLTYLEAAPKLRGYYTDGYKPNYDQLEKTIRDWFRRHAADLGPIARCLRANFMLTYVGGEHEELMRGGGAGATRTNGILAALRDLHRPQPQSAADCPKMPEELEEDERRRLREERAYRPSH
ncbi:MAG TPA: hypothetical protein VHW96_04275 [Solirubrobacteraceae bacterium]|nr:hypothetical protein [Solirubrobacteraceae bacterium]